MWTMDGGQWTPATGTDKDSDMHIDTDTVMDTDTDMEWTGT